MTRYLTASLTMLLLLACDDDGAGGDAAIDAGADASTDASAGRDGGGDVDTGGDGDGDTAGDGDGNTGGDGNGDGGGNPSQDACGNDPAMADDSTCPASLHCRPVGADLQCVCPANEMPPSCTSDVTACDAFPGTVCSELPTARGYYCVLLCDRVARPPTGTCPDGQLCVAATDAIDHPHCTAGDPPTVPACETDADCTGGADCRRIGDARLCILQCPDP